KQARETIAGWRAAKEAESKARSGATAKAYNLFPGLAALGASIALLFGVGVWFMGRSFLRFLIGFPFIFLLATVAYFLAAQSGIRAWGLEYVLWAIVLGMVVSNTVGTPKWVEPAVQVEFFIKTGLVLLGASVLVGKILLIGLPGIFVTWVVTPIVLVATFWFGQRVLKMESKRLNMVVSADMSVCGVSAAIATAAACRASKEELTLAVGISILFTAIMLFAMPAFIKAVGMDHVLGGAWMGGTIDATGAVVAAGALLGDTAMHVAATIKMIQNILIGVIAFAVAAYWATKVERTPGVDLSARAALREVWVRFPKFVLGFLAASIVFSLIYQWLGSDAGNVLLDQGVIRGWTADLQGWFFCLAFVSIGLATDFRDLAHLFKGGKPLTLYVVGQTFSLLLSLGMAYLMFFVAFPWVRERLLEP
ncbi:MAG: YeiH family protein, partial [Burkholderiales bacterium]